MGAKKSKFVKFLIILAGIVFLLTAVFLMGRYGWKLGGFDACEHAGITSVEVKNDTVRITGFYPGSAPEGFCGYYSQEQDGTLYVGFRFSLIFGIFESGNIDITIPVQGEIREVVLKTGIETYPIWTAQRGMVPLADSGVYVKLERNDVVFITMSYEGSSGGMRNADFSALETGEYFRMDNDIMAASMEAGKPVPFTVTAKDAEGAVLASGIFSFDANVGNMFLIVTSNNEIVIGEGHE